MDKHEPGLSGHCLCGAIKVYVRGRLAALTFCHCTQCRKSSGGTGIAVLPVAASDFSLDDKRGLLREFRASTNKVRCFCAQCGSPVYSRRDHADSIRVRAGLFADQGSLQLMAHIFCQHVPAWLALPEDGAARYSGLEPGRNQRH